MATAPPASGPKDCHDRYMAGLRAAEASGDYTRYQQLAEEHRACLAQFGPADYASPEYAASWSRGSGAGSRDSGPSPPPQGRTPWYQGYTPQGSAEADRAAAAADREAAYQRALANAQRAGDRTAIENLKRAHGKW